MASYDNAYSRFVALARIVLPLAALGILSTLFLVSHGSDPDQGTLPYVRVEIEEIAREQRIGAPEFAGVTEDGTAIALTADVARPETDSRGSAEALNMRFDMPDGSRTDLSAAAGTLDMQAGQTVLEGNVEIESSAGYRVRTDRVSAAIGRTEIVTDGPVQGEGPAGRLQAGRMQITEDPAAGGRYLLVFKDGVKLVYEPGR